MRIFVAAHVPQYIRTYIARYIEGIRDIVDGVKWEPEEKIHVTLRFIGERSDSEVQQIRAALREYVGSGPISVELEGIGGFPSARSPRVIFIGLKDDGSLRKLKEKIDTCLVPLSIDKENRQYIPHITIGRAKNRVKISGNLPALEKKVFKIERFSVFKSELFPAGSVYKALETYEL